MSYKFMQISDIGFNSSLCGNQDINKYIEILRRNAFENMINICIKEKVTALLICGNLYNEKNITVENVKIIKSGFAKLKAHSIAIVYAHGSMDKGPLLSSFLSEVIDFQNDFFHKEYSLPCNIDSITFVGSGYENNILTKIHALNINEKSSICVGLLYIDKQLYNISQIERIYNMLEQQKINYWALGGESHFVKLTNNLNFGYSGFAVPTQNNVSGCLLIEISNKDKIKSKLFPICNVVFKNLYIDGLELCNDVYILIQKCISQIQDNKKNNIDLIANIQLLGPCKCYNNVVNHLSDIEEQIAKITKANITIDTSMLYKNISINKDIDDINLNNLLEKCYQLYDDDVLYNKIINKLKENKVFYSKGVENIDKKQILEGLDSILIESALKEDVNDN